MEATKEGSPALSFGYYVIYGKLLGQSNDSLGIYGVLGAYDGYDN